jgi:uncharacterized membrane protein
MNTKLSSRSPLPDILKGIAVIRMILVHLMAVFATQEIYDSTSGRLIVFLAGPPGAVLFMLIMGYFIALSQKGKAITVIRGLKLLVWGLLLNIGMNFHLLVKIFSGSMQVDPWSFVFGADILFLAGFSLIILAFFRGLFQRNITAWILMALFFTLAGNIMPVYSGDAEWLVYLQAFFLGNAHWSYFPVFPWVAYPVAGYVFQILDEKYRLYGFSRKGLIYISSTLFVLLLISFQWGFSISIDFYDYHHHSLLYFIWVIMLVSFWVILIRLLVQNKEQKPVGKYLQWVGRYITNFYIFQWLLIGNIGTVLYKTQSAPAIVGWFLVILMLTSVLVFLWISFKKALGS